MEASPTRIDLLFQNSPLAGAVTLIVAGSLAAVASTSVPGPLVAAWIGATTLVATCRCWMVFRFRRNSTAFTASGWAWCYRALAVANGLTWGTAAVLFLPHQTNETSTFTVFVLGGMAAGSVPLVSADRWAAVAFISPILLPLSFQLALDRDDAISRLMSATVLIFMFALWASSRYTHARISQTLELGQERTELLSRTQLALAREKTAEQGLREANDALERRVVDRTAALENEIVERRAYAEKLSHLANHDALTGLPNRLKFFDRLQRLIDVHTQQAEGAALLFVDLDRFKMINDSLGHVAGDQLLQIVATRLKSVTRSTDMVARLGGDEFVFVIRGVKGEHVPRRVARDVFQVLEAPVSLDGQSFYVGCSIGVSRFPMDGRTAEDLLKKSHLALRRAKEGGRDRLRFYSKNMSLGINRRLVLETELRRAHEAGELEVWYQPIIDAATGKTRGLEALLRWTHPEMGSIPPGIFIPMAEETGLIVPIGETVLTLACQQAQQWSRAVGGPYPVAVNLSPRQFLEADLVRQVKQALQASGLDPSSLELEVTEGLIIADATRTVETFTALKNLGVRIAIDDFGTGYSSLNYLKHFPIDWLKIDKSFVSEITEPGDASQIVTAIIGLAHNLGFGVTAEGVETEAQRSRLENLRCDAFQGFLFSKALRPEDVIPWLTRAPADCATPASDRPHLEPDPAHHQGFTPSRPPRVPSQRPDLLPQSA